MSSPSNARAKRTKSRVVRRSFALPAELIERVSEAAPPEYGDNLNAAVRHALEEFVRRKDDQEFAREMAAMAADPQIQAINADLNHAFRHTLMDGLPDDPAW